MSDDVAHFRVLLFRTNSLPLCLHTLDQPTLCPTKSAKSLANTVAAPSPSSRPQAFLRAWDDTPPNARARLTDRAAGVCSRNLSGAPSNALADTHPVHPTNTSHPLCL